jgi:septal ring factor EnvC (AmiA/AmiB activator)
VRQGWRGYGLGHWALLPYRGIINAVGTGDGAAHKNDNFQYSGENMKRYAWLAILTAILLAGPIGCGKKEVDDLKAKVTGVEKELADTKGKLADRDKEAAELKAKAEQNQANIDTLTAELVKLKAENKKLQQETKKR